MGQHTSRPLSPHLGIWRWGPAMTISILHRVTGDGMAIIGGLLLSWWLFALASGPEYYAMFQSHMGAWYGYAVLVGLSWAFFQHLVSGLRHFVLDVGAGYDVAANNRWSAILPLVSIALTAALWSAIIYA